MKKGLIKLIVGTGIILVISGCGNQQATSKPTPDPAPAKQTDTTNSKDNKVTTTPEPVVPVSKPAPPAHTNVIKEIYDLGKLGKVTGADFISGKDIIDKVHDAWGKADKPIVPGGPLYEGYTHNNGTYAFGIGRGDIICDVRFFGNKDVDLSTISFADIKGTVGGPDEVRTNGNDDILVYKRGEYEIKFVGPHDKKILNHIAVFSPRAAAPMGGYDKK